MKWLLSSRYWFSHVDYKSWNYSYVLDLSKFFQELKFLACLCDYSQLTCQSFSSPLTQALTEDHNYYASGGEKQV